MFELIKREVLGRYRGSIVGLAWSFFNPILMLMTYTFFFTVVFKARWGSNPAESRWEFAIILFVGLIIHGLFAECINRAPSLITGNVSYVKKIIFPLEILPCIAMGSALFHTAISILVLLVAKFILGMMWSWSLIFFPLILAPLVLTTLGVAWFLAATGVYVRDISQITGVITSILMFTSPIFFPLSSLPPQFKAVVLFNPLTLIIEQSRKVLIFNIQPDWVDLGVYTLISMLIAWGGFWWFQKTRKGFADVL